MKFRKILALTFVATALLTAASLQAAKSKTQDLLVPYAGTIAGTHIASGQYRVKCETNGTSAKLTFILDWKVVATVEGRVVNRSEQYSVNEVVYQKKPDGSRYVQEIRFAHPNEVIVFND